MHRSQPQNKAVIDRRLCPRCCHLGSYFKRPKTSPLRPLACNWYYCAFFIAKPKAAHALRSVMGLLQLRYEHDSSTIRARFEHDSATTRYEMRTIRVRFERDTTSYEELCAFEQ